MADTVWVVEVDGDLYGPFTTEEDARMYAGRQLFAWPGQPGSAQPKFQSATLREMWAPRD